MEKAGFALTVFAGLLSCVLLAWQGYEGSKADWVSGFLCVLWSLLMLMRLMSLTAPASGKGDHPHLARKIITAFYNNEEKKRQAILQQSFGPSFALFLGLGMAFILWQIVCAFFPASNFALAGFSEAVADFFEGSGTAPLLPQSFLFELGHGFLSLLCLSMMGFLLRSYSSYIPSSRVALLVLAAYVGAGWLTFLGYNPQAESAAIEPTLTGMGLQGSFLIHPATLFDKILVESGIFGIALMAFILFIPLGFICLSFHKTNPDWIVLSVGTLGAFSLITSVFFPLHPAMAGFVFLCWMAVFLAWGASEFRARPNFALTKEQR